MLKILKKIAERDAEGFTDSELRQLAPNFRLIVQLQRADILEKIWPLIPTDKREETLLRALPGGKYMQPDTDDGSTFRFLMAKAEECFSQESWDGLFDSESQYDTFGQVVASGSTENVDLYLTTAVRHQGEEAAREILTEGGTNPNHVHMVDHMMNVCLQYGGHNGGRVLQEEFIEHSIYFMQSVIQELELKRHDDEHLDAALHVLRKAHEIGGPSLAEQGYLKLFEEDPELVMMDAMSARMTRVLDALAEIKDPALIKNFLSQHDYEIPDSIISATHYDKDDEAADEKLYDRFIGLAALTQDEEVIGRIGKMVAEARLRRTWFEEYADEKIARIEAGTITPEEAQLRDTYIQWHRESHGLFEDEIKELEALPIDELENRIFEDIADTYPPVLKVLGALNQAFDRPHSYEHIVANFHDFIEHNLQEKDFVIDFFNYVRETRGDKYLFHLLDGTGKKAHPFPIFVQNQSVECIRVYIEFAQAVGGEAFVQKLFAGRANDFSIFAADWQAKDFEKVSFLLGYVAEEDIEKALAKLPPDWMRLHEKRITKTAFHTRWVEGKARWVAMTGSNPPHEELAQCSPYRFKPKLYEAIYPALLAAENINEPHYNTPQKRAHHYAFKLATLFSSEQEIEQYLTKFQQGEGNVLDRIDDALDFELPKQGEWDQKRWSALVLKYGSAVFPYIEHAPAIEALADRFPSTPQELRAYVPHDGFIHEKKDPRLTVLAKHFGYKEEEFDKMLAFSRKNLRHRHCYIPEIEIDGADLGLPGYYMKRLPPDDVLGYFLGLITGDCQYWGGNGDPCVKYGTSSPHSGFYLWYEKAEDGKSQDHIVAQSWAWIGIDDRIVFDSFECDPEYHHLAQPFLEQFAHQTVNQHTFNDYHLAEGNERTISGVRLGFDDDGRTPKLALPEEPAPAVPVAYKGRYDDRAQAYDSHQQYIITPVDHTIALGYVLETPPVTAPMRKMAIDYIAATTEKLRAQFGLDITTSINLQAYPVDGNGNLPLDNNYNLILVPQYADKIQSLLREKGLAEAFSAVAPINEIQQGNFSTHFLEPRAAIHSANKLRKVLSKESQTLEVPAHTFDPLVHRKFETSGATVSIGLRSLGEPPSEYQGAAIEQTARLARRILSFQRHTVLPVAWFDEDYPRYWNKKTSPRHFRVGTADDNQASLRMIETNNNYSPTNTAPHVVIENRMPPADADLTVAVAVSIAAIEFALDGQRVTGETITSMPQNRLEAAQALYQADCRGLFKGKARELLMTIAEAHLPLAANANILAVPLVAHMP